MDNVTPCLLGFCMVLYIHENQDKNHLSTGFIDFAQPALLRGPGPCGVSLASLRL